MENKDMKYLSYNINKFNIELESKLFTCQVFWARVISSENDNLFTNYTKHSFYEIQYALKGNIDMIIKDNTLLSFTESEFVIIPPDTYHQITNKNAEGARFIMAFSITPNSDTLKQAIDGFLSGGPYRETAHMRNILSVILKKSYFDNELRRESINALMKSFFLEVLETVCLSSNIVEETNCLKKDEKSITEIEQFIRNYNGVGIRVQDISENFSLSTRQLNRIFVRLRGYTLKNAINKEKLKKIEDLIASTSLSLYEISELCGFSDEYSMNKFFKRLNKINISEFKKSVRKK